MTHQYRKAEDPDEAGAQKEQDGGALENGAENKVPTKRKEPTMAAIKSVKALTGCTAGLKITENFSEATKYMVEYESGSIRYYDVDKTPKTVQNRIDSHREPEPEEIPMERAENFAQQMLQLPVAVQDKAWEELETILEPDELETAKAYVGSYHLLTDQAFYNAARDALAEELYQELREPEPEIKTTVSPLAALTLAGLFLAGTAVSVIWWITQALALIEKVFWIVVPKARAWVIWTRAAWVITEPEIVKAAESARTRVAESLSFRAVILSENGSMGRV